MLSLDQSPHIRASGVKASYNFQALFSMQSVATISEALGSGSTQTCWVIHVFDMDTGDSPS